MKDKIKIAILDTGINALHPYLIGNISSCYDIIQRKEHYDIKLSDNNNNDSHGHGTACASVIKSICSDINLYSFKILDKNGICNVLKLEETLTFIEKMDINIINLSLSIIDKIDANNLANICKRLWNKNKLVIASLGNEQKRGYPAMLKNCIGVQGFILKSIDSIWFCPLKKVQSVVDNTPFLHCNKEGDYSMFGKCNSYSAAKLTGIVALMANQNNSFDVDQILKELKALSERKYWNRFDLQQSKRVPNILQYRDSVDKTLVKEVEVFIKEYFYLENNFSLEQTLLFSKEVGVMYKDCYNLLKKLENKFKFTVDDYTKISREDFYSIYSLAKLIQFYG